MKRGGMPRVYKRGGAPGAARGYLLKWLVFKAFLWYKEPSASPETAGLFRFHFCPGTYLKPLPAMRTIKPARSIDWTKERIDALTTPDVRQLRANAERLNAPDVMQLCDAVLGERPRGGGPGTKRPVAAPRPRKSRKKAPETETGGAA